MNIGELFISLGIKGSEKTLGALSSAKTGMTDLKSVTLETKAAILAAFYAMERLLTGSAQVGAHLENFQSLTGVSAVLLQRYQYAARQVGVSNEEMTSSFKSVQNAMTAMRLGEGAPKGLGILAQRVGFDANRAKTDTAYVIKKLQEYALKEQEVGMRNFVLRSFGMSDNVISAMARNAFRPEMLAKAPAYSENELKQLDRANAAWSNLGNKIQMAVGHFNAIHGVKLVSDLSKVTSQVIKLIDAFTKLSDKLHLFNALGKVFEGWTSIFSVLSDEVNSIGKGVENFGKTQKNKGTAAAIGETAKNLVTGENGIGQHLSGIFSFLVDAVKQGTLSPTPSVAKEPSLIAPSIGPSNGTQGKVQNNQVTQTFNFQTDGRDHKQVGDATQKAVTKAFFQIPLGGI